MSQTTETRTVQKSVNVIHCDGPDCNVEHVAQDQYTNERAPSGWYVASLNVSYQRYPEKDTGPWHFHTLACFSAWAALQRAQELLINATKDQPK